MDKFSTKNNATFEIKEGASEGAIIAVVADFAVLGDLADALSAPGNLDEVKFATDDNVTGVYDNMTMDAPLFKAVDVVDGMVQATFAIRSRTEMELAIEELQAGQSIQDGAIGDLGAVVGEIAEGGTV